jgi:hypothetical protein
VETNDPFAEFDLTDEERKAFSNSFDYGKPAQCQDFPSGWGQLDGAGLWT